MKTQGGKQLALTGHFRACESEGQQPGSKNSAWAGTVDNPSYLTPAPSIRNSSLSPSMEWSLGNARRGVLAYHWKWRRLIQGQGRCGEKGHQRAKQVRQRCSILCQFQFNAIKTLGNPDIPHAWPLFSSRRRAPSKCLGLTSTATTGVGTVMLVRWQWDAGGDVDIGEVRGHNASITMGLFWSPGMVHYQWS